MYTQQQAEAKLRELGYEFREESSDWHLGEWRLDGDRGRLAMYPEPGSMVVGGPYVKITLVRPVQSLRAGFAEKPLLGGE